MTIEIETSYERGNKKVKLTQEYRFSKWLNAPNKLSKWEKHFQNQGIATAVGKSEIGFALFKEIKWEKIKEDE